MSAKKVSASEFEIPASSGEAAVAIVIHVITVVASAAAVLNLAYFGTTSICGLVSSILWILVVCFYVWIGCTEDHRGPRQHLINHLGFYSRRQFAALTKRADASTGLSFSYRIFGLKFDYLRFSADQITSVDWSPGQASDMAGEDMNEWHVAVWYRLQSTEKRKPSTFFPGRHVYIVGPSRRRQDTDAFGRSFVEFLRSGGVDLVEVPCRKDRVKFMRSRIRCDLFDSGLVDDLFTDVREVTIERSGEARYTIDMRLDAEPDVHVLLWTSRKGRISVSLQDLAPWASHEMEDEDALGRLSAENCNCHLEHMDRETYWLGLTRDDQLVHVNFHTRGYLKTKVTRGDEMPGPPSDEEQSEEG